MPDPNVDPPAQGVPAATPNDAAPPAPDRCDALRDAFLLGAGIVELKNRIQISLIKQHDSGLRLASVWRASFNRLAALQGKTFMTSATAQTLYEPPGQESLPYLYPPNPDYADVGIVGKSPDGTAILGDFKLYEVTRRAINCLTLLYVKEEESLIPDVIKQNQERLVAAILLAAQDPGGGGGDSQAMEDVTAPPEGNPLEEAKAVLTERTVKFLDAWDGYLRENFYAGGKFQNDDLELVAYESGHSMSSFSWGIASATEALEHQAAATTEDYTKAWQSVFRVQNVNRLQHQISALSSELDDAYYADHPEQKRIAANAVLVVPNPDLPSQSIQAVKNSIDYWQRTVNWIPDNLAGLRHPDPAHPAPWSNKLRLALAEQANIWQTLLTGQQSLRAYNMESVTHEIMRGVTTRIQENVRTDFYGNLRQAEQAMKEVAQEVKEAIDTAQEIAVNGLEELFRSFKRVLLPVLAIIILIFVGLLVYAWANNHLASGGASVIGLISTVLGYFGLGNLKNVKTAQQTAIQAENNAAKSKVDNQAAAAGGATEAAGAGGSSILTSIQGAAQQTGTIILQALERGYEQARIELDGLSRSVAVAYPLVEFFGLQFTVESDVAVLTNILWSKAERDAEIERVTRAAFGPLSVFIVSSGNKAPEQIGDGNTNPATSD